MFPIFGQESHNVLAEILRHSPIIAMTQTSEYAVEGFPISRIGGDGFILLGLSTLLNLSIYGQSAQTAHKCCAQQARHTMGYHRNVPWYCGPAIHLPIWFGVSR